MAWAGRLGLGLCVAAAMSLAAPALAHPSDDSTLTLDLLFGPQGLEAIDGAVVESEGGAYEPFPSDETKERVAIETLRTLGIPARAVHIDASDSPRYHQVGFVIRVEDPDRVSRPLRIQTRALWDVASDLGLARLKVSVCGVKDSFTAPARSVLDDLGVRASRDGRDPQGLDRTACTVWDVAESGDAVQIVADATELPATGPPVRGVLAGTMAVVLLGVGGGALAGSAGSRRRVRRTPVGRRS